MSKLKKNTKVKSKPVLPPFDGKVIASNLTKIEANKLIKAHNSLNFAQKLWFGLIGLFGYKRSKYVLISPKSKSHKLGFAVGKVK